MSPGTVFLAGWVTGVVILVAASVMKSMLVFKLREGYPSIYEKVGKPIAFSQSASFLWRLEPYRPELNAKDLALLKRTIALFHVLSVLMAAGVAFAVVETFSNR